MNTSHRIAIVMAGTVVLSSCSFDSLHRASSECEARAIEYRLSGMDKVRHKNLCMASKGYMRNTLCSSEAFANSGAEMCYTPRWKFWTEEQKLL